MLKLITTKRYLSKRQPPRAVSRALTDAEKQARDKEEKKIASKAQEWVQNYSPARKVDRVIAARRAAARNGDES
jgi:hypothetical protein